MFLSVIIPTRNRAQTLADALESLVGQDLAPSEFEVLVVDNDSCDDTVSVAEHYRDRLPVTYVRAPEPGLHVGRHAGLVAARGEILVYADDDIVAFSSWLSAIRDSFGDPSVALVGGNNLPRYDSTPPAWLSRMWQESRYLGGHALPELSILELPDGTRAHDPYYVWGCNFAVRKQVVLEAGGFHPDAMPKELIRYRGDGETHVARFVSESGQKTLFNSKASVYHLVSDQRMTPDYFRRRAFNQGISDSYSDLRAGLGDRFSGPLRSLKSAARSMKRVLKYAMTDRQLFEVKTEARRGYEDGYRFHQEQYRTDSALRDWVMQPDYFPAEIRQ